MRFEIKDNPTAKEVRIKQNRLKHRLIRVLFDVDFSNEQLAAAFDCDWDEMESKVEMLESIAVAHHDWDGRGEAKGA